MRALPIGVRLTLVVLRHSCPDVCCVYDGHRAGRAHQCQRRVDPARSRDAGGAGLGPSIARWIAEAHRASIRVESTPGVGSVFELRMPRVVSSV
jgi:light-regulated signal transduction histidine kinase (bacteriophytochrome)